MESNTDLLFTFDWTKNLINIIDSQLDEDKRRALLCQCATMHYANLNMDELLSPYQGKLNEFIEFLHTEWGWIVHYDEKEGIIETDENKEYCVCPIVKQSNNSISKTICHCSEGFAKLMFSKVLGKSVTTRVVKSILYGDKSCVYRIHIKQEGYKSDSNK